MHTGQLYSIFIFAFDFIQTVIFYIEKYHIVYIWGMGMPFYLFYNKIIKFYSIVFGCCFFVFGFFALAPFLLLETFFQILI